MAEQNRRRLPILTSVQGYKRTWVTRDLIAGLTLWAVLVPEALAYATIAGVSPVVGRYAAPPALVLYAVFGSSKHLIVGPTGRQVGHRGGRERRGRGSGADNEMLRRPEHRVQHQRRRRRVPTDDG